MWWSVRKIFHNTGLCPVSNSSFLAVGNLLLHICNIPLMTCIWGGGGVQPPWREKREFDFGCTCVNLDFSLLCSQKKSVSINLDVVGIVTRVLAV